MSDFRGRMQEYLDVLKYQKNYSDLTIQAYQRDIEQFFLYLREECIEDLSDVQYSFLRGYLSSLHQQNLSAKTINHKMSSLRGFYRYLQNQDLSIDITSCPNQRIGREIL